MNKSNWFACISLPCLVLLMSCSSNPEPIAFGKDVCQYCKMVISDPRFGAELITGKGRIYKYDALECMISHIHEEAPEYNRLLAIAYNSPRNLFPVDSLFFVQSPDYKSPMGENLAAFYGSDTLKGIQIMNWTEIFQHVNPKK